MDINQLPTNGKLTISGYGKDFFSITKDKTYSNIIISPNKFQRFSDKCFDNGLSLEDVGYNPDKRWIVIIGFRQEEFLDSYRTQTIIDLYYNRYTSIAVEVMDVGAACRTYNVLVSEDRDVIGILCTQKKF